jgi:hypothetical protein
MHAELAVVEYVPAPQSVHRADPVSALYFPATHVVHEPPSGPVHPALQVQFVNAVLPAGESEFDGQALHVELAAVEYVPAPQSVLRTSPQDASKRSTTTYRRSSRWILNVFPLKVGLITLPPKREAFSRTLIPSPRMGEYLILNKMMVAMHPAIAPQMYGTPPVE